MGITLRTPAIAIAVTVLTLLSAANAAAGIRHIDHFEYVAGSAGALAIEQASDGSAAAVWLADNGGSPGMLRFTPDGQEVTRTVRPTSASASGTLRRIAGLAFDSAATTIFASDSPNHRLLGFDSVGGLPETQAPGGVPQPGGCVLWSCPQGSSAAGSFNHPLALDFAGGQLYVADAGNSRVQVLGTTLGYVREFSRAEWGDGEPRDVSVDPATGHVFVAIDDESAVDEFDAAGAYIRSIAAPAPAAADEDDLDAVATAIDGPAGMLFVARENRALDVIDAKTGSLLERFGGLPGRARDIVVDPHAHRIFVSIGGDTRTVKIYEYDAPPTCEDESTAVGAGQPTVVELDCVAPEGTDAIFYELIDPPDHGTVENFSSTDGTFTYVPNPGFSGVDSLTYRASTSAGVSEIKTVTFNVAASPVVMAAAADEPPVIRESTNISWQSGEIFVKPPGAQDFVQMKGEVHLPIGTVVDASNGRCKVFLANQDKSIYSSTFWGGVFQIKQGAGDNPIAEIKMRDDLVDEADEASASSAATASLLLGIAKKKGKKKNKVWGNGKGKFRTSGSGGSASVRGTRWMVENYTNGTLFKVTSGKVLVRDFGKRKSLMLKPGKSYFAFNKKKSKKTRR